MFAAPPRIFFSISLHHPTPTCRRSPIADPSATTPLAEECADERERTDDAPPPVASALKTEHVGEFVVGELRSGYLKWLPVSYAQSVFGGTWVRVQGEGYDCHVCKEGITLLFDVDADDMFEARRRLGDLLYRSKFPTRVERALTSDCADLELIAYECGNFWPSTRYFRGTNGPMRVFCRALADDEIARFDKLICERLDREERVKRALTDADSVLQLGIWGIAVFISYIVFFYKK